MTYAMSCRACSLCPGLRLAQLARAQDQPRQQHVGRVQDWSYRHVTMSGGLPAADLDKAKAEPRILFRLAERNLHRARCELARADSVGVTAVRGGRSAPRSREPEDRLEHSPGRGHRRAQHVPGQVQLRHQCDTQLRQRLRGVRIERRRSDGRPGQSGRREQSVQRHRPPTLRRESHRELGVQREHGRRCGPDFPGNFSGRHKDRLCGERRWSGRLPVLTWKAGEGTSATAAATPTLNGACTGRLLPTSSCLKSVTFSTTATDTLASPWVDYQTDKAFVGSNDGKIYRISCVFNCALNTNPTVDWTFTLPVAGTGGAAAQPNGPVYDFPSGRLFVGDQLGELWTINASGATPTLFAGPVMIGGGGCTIANPPGRTGTPAPIAPPMADLLASRIPSSGQLGGSQGFCLLRQRRNRRRQRGRGPAQRWTSPGWCGSTSAWAAWEPPLPTGIIHTGAFDNAYFGATPSNGHLFLCGTGRGQHQPTHYWIGFTLIRP